MREERGRVEEGGIEVMGGVEGYGKRGGGMTKGDSCDANPSTCTHVHALPISVHHLSTFFLFLFLFYFFFSCPFISFFSGCCSPETWGPITVIQS